MNRPQMIEFQENFLQESKKQLGDAKNTLKQVSQILEKKTYLQGGWPEELWLYIKKDLQTRMEELKQRIEKLERYSL